MTAAYRDEGTSVAYLPVPFPAVASLEVTNSLVNAANNIGRKTHSGIGFTRDAFYIQDVDLNEKLQLAGVVATEMEASALFVAGAWHGVQTRCIVASDSNIWLDEQPTLEEKERLYFEGERYVIEIALDAVELLAGDTHE